MTTTTLPEPAHSLPALCAPGRSPEISVAADVYGWLVGSWGLDVLFYLVDVSPQNLKAEAHFSWALERRALQEVWIMPRRHNRTAPPDRSYDMYGTTLRIWDPSLHAWRVTWFNPVTGQRDELIGGSDGHDIVQIGTHADGTPIRWHFTEISSDSFLWTGEALQPDGKTWKLQGQFRARRLAMASFEKGQSL